MRLLAALASRSFSSIFATHRHFIGLLRVFGWPPGAVIGGVIGGIAGGFGGAELGEMAASGYYGRLDADQKKQVEAFIYQHYGVNR